MPLATPGTQVDDLVVKTLIAAEPTISQSIHDNIPSSNRGEPNRTCFQVFGFDVMLDAHAKPWLLEVNLDPALRTESPLDLKIKSQMIIDLLNVVGMPVPPPPPPPPEPGEEGEEGEGVGGGEEGSKAAVDVSDAAGASTSGAGGGSSSAAEGADGAPLKTPRATGFGSGVLPTPLFEDAHQAAADWKRRRAADILEAQSDPSLASPATTGAASSSSTTAESPTANATPLRSHTRLNPNAGPQAAAAAAALTAANGPGTDFTGGSNSIPAGFTGYDASVAPALSDIEQWFVFLVNAEYERSKKGKWRRLFPSERSSEYFQFFDVNHKLHFLPYGV